MFGMSPKTSIRILAALGLLLLFKDALEIIEMDTGAIPPFSEAPQVGLIYFGLVAVVVAAFISLGGLLFLKEWSRWLFSLAFVAALVGALYLWFPEGTEAMSFYDWLRNDLGQLINGATLALMWSPIWKMAQVER